MRAREIWGIDDVLSRAAAPFQRAFQPAGTFGGGGPEGGAKSDMFCSYVVALSVRVCCQCKLVMNGGFVEVLREMRRYEEVA